MKLLGVLIVCLAYVAFLVCVVNMVIEWMGERDRKRMGLGCWLYQTGLIRKP